MDVDEGVTPFMSACPDHGLSSTSAFYPSGIERDSSLLPVRMLWRKATPAELKRERKDGGDHYARGGLAREFVNPPAPPRPVAVPDPPRNRQQRRWAGRHA